MRGIANDKKDDLFRSIVFDPHEFYSLRSKRQRRRNHSDGAVSLCRSLH